jgi:Fe2+ or Zn2+ uptake regulation protein
MPHNIRHGISLTPLQTRIFDAIKNAGAEGISREVLYSRLFAERNANGYSTVYVHLNAIRFLLADSGWQITFAGRTGKYRLVRTTPLLRVASR